MTRERVLIVDQRNRYPVQLCPPLSHRGCDVDAFAERGAPILHSRYCARRIASPPWYAGESFRAALESTVASGGYDVIYVCSEQILETLLPTLTERHEALVAAAVKVFEALQYTGIADLDFIRDVRDGSFRFLEINPRPWASIGLALQAADLLSAYHGLARGVAVETDLGYRTGLVYHRLWGEFRLMRERPSRIRGFVKDCLSPHVMSDFDPSDIWPHLPIHR